MRRFDVNLHTTGLYNCAQIKELDEFMMMCTFGLNYIPSGFYSTRSRCALALETAAIDFSS